MKGLRRRWKRRHLRGREHLAKKKDRRDVKRYELNEDLWVDVFWKILEIGRGPALSVYACGYEALKYDCFGPGEGHFHAQLVEPDEATEERIFFAEETVEAQIDRCLFELRNNAAYFLQRHPNRHVRRLEVDSEAIAELVPKLRDLMGDYARRAAEG